jgi:type I restriction enzyme R subunit
MTRFKDHQTVHAGQRDRRTRSIRAIFANSSKRKKIIVSTVQKFPFILDEIATEPGRSFAIVIDEAHSSQGGKTSAAMSQALGKTQDDEDGPDPEDTVNEALEKRMASRKLLANASYFAFTATPKNKTLEMFGEALPPDTDGKVKHRPFHGYR